jgi:hypothetical protein
MCHAIELPCIALSDAERAHTPIGKRWRLFGIDSTRCHPTVSDAHGSIPMRRVAAANDLPRFNLTVDRVWLRSGCTS